ncbi:uncharacterized protein LOC131667841 isoform X2 [Phymastichus coffea]|uniref:uncharacterized protein LOC131667841 isoform X2 n=1 Tax=Phymastichus coffea TaxID=108790 RepID=UPI00273CC9FD|nr:uncharacterized protein LOC131667841 isoform X2 [Phymastichus coffea]
MALYKRNIHYFAVGLLLSLYPVEPVSAIRCYACNSDTQPECISAADQDKFIIECSSYVSNTKSLMFSSFYEHAAKAKAVVEYDCASARGISTKDGRTIVQRGCAIKPVTCETYKIIFAVGDGKGNGFQVDTCNRCSTSLCNSYP